MTALRRFILDTRLRLLRTWSFEFGCYCVPSVVGEQINQRDLIHTVLEVHPMPNP